MNHETSPKFWALFRALPRDVRALAVKNYGILRRDPSHPSLEFKKVGRLWSVRVGLHYRALGLDRGNEVFWFWIGPHAEYDYKLKNF